MIFHALVVIFEKEQNLKLSSVAIIGGALRDKWWLRVAQRLSSRVIDLRLRVRTFKPHWMLCIVSLSKTHHPLLSTGSTQEEGLQDRASPDALHSVLEQDTLSSA